MKRKRGWLLGPLVILALLLCAIPAYASIPGMPHPFYGTLNIGGSLAPVGTVVTAEVGGVECGTITTTVEGQYGGPGAYDPKLVVSGDIETGATIYFYADGNVANETYPFSPGADPTELNLTVTVADTTPPTVTIVALTPDPTNNNTPTFTGTATDTQSNISSVEYKVDSGSWTAATAVDGAFNGKSEEYSFTTAELLDGAHTVYVRATDAATNTTAEADYASDSFTVDTAAPTVTINAVTTPTNVATQTLTGTMEEGTTVVLTADTAATFGDVSYDTTTWSCDVTLVEGSNVITATATDAAGNTATAEATIVLDTVAPVVEITSPSEDALLNSLEVTIEGTATEVDEVVVGGLTAPVVDGAFSIILTLNEGANSVTATATDAAGNVGSDTVNFNIVVVTHTLTMAVVGVGIVTPESGDYPEGDMTITATIPASGWEFSGWTTTDMAEIANPTSAETTLTLDKDKTVTATFTEVVTYDLTVASTAGGTVTDPGEDAFTYNAGTVVSLVAVPEDGYTFGWWSGDIGMIADVNAASTTITMNSDKSIVANFVEFSAPENVSVTEIDPGVESVTVTIEPVEELNVSQMPAGIDPQEAYVVESTGTGSFTLIFTDVSNASDIRVYKVVDGTWTLLDITVVDATTIKVTMEVGDPVLVFALPPATIGTVTLPAGWNLLSTPIKLDADSDSLGQILGQSVANIEVSYRWDTQSQQWAVPTGYELSPLEAVYVKVSSGVSATAEFIPSEELSQPPIRELQPGLNLIGPAPALEAGVFPDTPLNQALISIAEAEGGLRGYTMVVSPEHNQPGWAYALGGEIKDLLPYKGYWVVMENADTLYGFSTTPISP